jgi:hypothetical protein
MVADRTGEKNMQDGPRSARSIVARSLRTSAHSLMSSQRKAFAGSYNG